MHIQPPPQPREILPPLLACLPTAFLAPRPPPALLPLLSPLLRQRVNFLSNSTSQPQRTREGDDGWLPLLTWSPARAKRLPPIIERMQLEPHPVSGELELDDVRAIKYRRLDRETLQSRLEVDQFDLLPLYVWCDSDDHAGEEGSGPGWKLAELRSLEDEEVDDDKAEWYDSIPEANEACTAAVATSNGTSLAVPPTSQQQPQQKDDDDDYWAAYDSAPTETPGHTPAQKRSPAPYQKSTSATQPGGSSAEADYYARYGEEVQPALDSHDPDEDHPEFTGSSTLNGDLLVTSARNGTARGPHFEPDASNLGPGGYDSSFPVSEDNPRNNGPSSSTWQGKSLFPADNPADIVTKTMRKEQEKIIQPRAISPSSSHSSIDRLEEKARQMSERGADDGSAIAQTAIKQHISTDVKSLFRLAKGVGMSRKEFERVMKRELEVLGIMDDEDDDD